MKPTLISPTLIRSYCQKVNYNDYIDSKTGELDAEAYQEALQNSNNLNDMILTNRVDVNEVAVAYNMSTDKVMELAYKGRF